MEPSTRALHILHVLQDLRPEQARSFLREAVSTLDAAELAALRRQLPAGIEQSVATELMDPHMMPTVQRTFPMPWEYAQAAAGPSTEQLVRAALRPARSRTVALAVAGLAGGALLGLGLYRAALRPAPAAPAPVATLAASPPAPAAALDPVPLAALVPEATPEHAAHRVAVARARRVVTPPHHEPAHRTSQAVEAARPFPDPMQSSLYGTRL